MKRLAIASAALLAIGGAAFAQEPPYLAGNYSASVGRSHDSSANRSYSHGGDRYYYAGQEYPRHARRYYRERDYYAGYYDPYPRYHRHHRYHRPHSGVGIGFSGPGFSFGFYDGWR